MHPWTPDPRTKAELDDAFQFTEPDRPAWSHVTRGWVEGLLAEEYHRGVQEGRATGQGRVISSTGPARMPGAAPSASAPKESTCEDEA